MLDHKVIPIDRPRAEPTLYDLPRHRLEAARHKAANACTVAMMRHQIKLVRQYQRIIDHLDNNLGNSGAA